MAREELGVAPESVTGAVFFQDETSPQGLGLPQGRHVRLGSRQRVVALALAGLILIAAVLAPRALCQGVYWSFFAVFLGGALIRLAAILTPRGPTGAAPLSDENLPSYTLIVPLYHEADLAAELVTHLDRLDYPRDRLQCLIVLEADDPATQTAFRALELPGFIQVLVVPPGTPRTKPRACNAALTFAKGDLVVIYDAEDAPDPLQLREAAARFALEGPDLACLQAPLRVETRKHPAFIPDQFRLEYAALFEVLLPAYARWGIPFPLGGTSNHFTVAALRDVGGWDPYNVTEDADIGFRLARAGYRLGTIERPTLETPPTSLDEWAPQRARWIKGHLQTLTVHTRLGAHRELRARLSLIVTLALPIASSNLHAPAMLVAALGMVLDQIADGRSSIAITDLSLYALGWIASAACGALGVRRSGGEPRALHLLGMAGYWTLWIIASPRAVWQFFFAPHHWDKTTHTPRTGRRAP